MQTYTNINATEDVVMRYTH